MQSPRPSATRCGKNLLILGSFIVAGLALAALDAHLSSVRAQTANAADDLKHNFAAQHEIGRRFRIDPAELPAPKTSPIVSNRPLTLPYSARCRRCRRALPRRRSRPGLPIRGGCWCCRTATFWSRSRARAI